jgi:hypothetical protein
MEENRNSLYIEKSTENRQLFGKDNYLPSILLTDDDGNKVSLLSLTTKAPKRRIIAAILSMIPVSKVSMMSYARRASS